MQKFLWFEIYKIPKKGSKISFTEEEYNKPHPVIENSYGSTYGEHREFLEFSSDQHQILYDNCKLNGLIYSSSVWDLNSAKNIVNLNPEFIKIGSATNLNFEVLDFLCSNFTGKIHLSLGMTTQSEEEKLLVFSKKKIDLQI